MQNGFYNKDLVLAQVFASNILTKTQTYKYIPIEINEHLEYTLLELASYVKFTFSIYFFVIYFIVFVNCFYGNFTKLDKIINRISGSIDTFIESEKEISPVDDFFVIIGYYIVVYA